MQSLIRSIRNPKLILPFVCGKTDLCLKEMSFSKVKTLNLCNLHSSTCNSDTSLTRTLQSDFLSRTDDDNKDTENQDKLYRLVEVEVRGNDKAVLKSYAWFSSTAAHHLGIEVGRSWTPKKAHHERYTVLRSIHVNKKCRVQYEFRTYFHFMQFLRLTGSTADTFLEYIQRNLPEGVAMKVTKIALETMPDHIKKPSKEDLLVEAT